MPEMSLTEHTHTPYPVLIHGELGKWREEHEGQMPKNYKEKKSFSQRILDRRRRRENNQEVWEDEENFEEAARMVNTVVAPTSIPSGVRDILGDQRAGTQKSRGEPKY